MADYRELIPWIRRWEGGLSRDPRDTAAAAHPAPCVYQEQTGWHTNKGIQWATFQAMAGYGYSASCENFFAMPDAIWKTVYKRGFWDQLLLDYYRSQAVADVLVQWIWGSGLKGCYRQLSRFFARYYSIQLGAFSGESIIRMKNEFNRLTRTKRGERQVYDRLINQLRAFYISLNRPEYIQGWLNRVNDLERITSPKIGSFASTGVLLTGLIFALAAASFFSKQEPQPITVAAA